MTDRDKVCEGCGCFLPECCCGGNTSQTRFSQRASIQQYNTMAEEFEYPPPRIERGGYMNVFFADLAKWVLEQEKRRDGKAK